MPGQKLVPLVLTDDERGALEALARRRKTSQALAEHAKIVLACAENAGTEPVTAVAARFGVSREMARKWRSRFLEKRLDGLADAPRPGAPKKSTREVLAFLGSQAARSHYLDPRCIAFLVEKRAETAAARDL